MIIDTRLTISRFMSLAKTGEAKLVGNRVVGKLAIKYLVVTDPARISERFANTPSQPASILEFTRRYGPLKTDAHAGQEFTVDLEEWRGLQTQFQNSWRMTTPANLPTPAELGITGYKAIARCVHLGNESWLGIGSKGAEFRTKDLWTLIEVCQGTIPVERLRICTNPDCKNPYFVAHHLKQTLCNATGCKEWNSRRLKLEYWERSKGPILEERKRIRKGEKHGTQKAR
jgi:hypothetical protein